VKRAVPASERSACRALDQHRSTQRYERRLDEDEPRLVRAMLRLIRKHPRFGYRRVWALLRADGWRVNVKRVHRLWKQNGLKVPVKRVKKRRLGTSENGITRRRAVGKDDVWSIDFIFDRTENGRSLKWLSVIDEFTRECLALEVDRTMNSEKVMELLGELVLIRGVPRHVRCDNGPEFIAKGIRRWLELSGVGTLYIEPGSPWQNGYVESFHARLRDELLGVEIFETKKEAKALSAQWRLDYNHRRPHSALGYQTPAGYAAGVKKTESPAVLPVAAAPLPPGQQAKDSTLS
jgi:putative transposase